MRTWTIGRKLYTVIGALVGLFFISEGIVYYEATTVRASANATQAAIARVVELADLQEKSMDLLFFEKAAISGAYSLKREDFEAPIQEAEKTFADINAALPGIMESLVAAENRDTLKQFDAGLAEWHRLFKEIEHLTDQGDPDSAQALSREKSRPLMEANVARAKSISDRLRAETERVHESNEASVNLLIATVVAVLGAALVIGAIAAWVARSSTTALQGLATGLADGAGHVTSASTQVSTSAQSLSQGSTEQAASLEETSASMEEMAAMTRQNADNAGQAAGLMSEVERQVRQSNDALQGMIRSMSSIQESSARVSKIIKTIDEIAFQTNILALNAAVEAARAGEAGMGFAVVADEVRNLAQRSAQAAKDTAVLIEESSLKAAQGGDQVGHVAAAIDGITGSVTKVKTLVDDVSAASRQQAQGIDQVTQAIGQMEKVTQTTAATAEESAAASEELSAQAETTMSLVHRLEAMVGGRPSTGAPPAVRRQHRATVIPLRRAEAGPAVPLSAAEQAIPLESTGTFGSF